MSGTIRGSKIAVAPAEEIENAAADALVKAFLDAAAKVPAKEKIKESQRKTVNAANASYAKLSKELKERADVRAAYDQVKAALEVLDNPKITFGNAKVRKALNGEGTKTKELVLKTGKKLALKESSTTGAKITSKSSNKKVAAVKNGVIRAKKKGSAVITLSCKKARVKVLIKVQ